MKRDQERSTTAVAQAVTMECVDIDGTTHQVATELTYDTSDPWGVTLTFRPPTGDIPWTFARELLVHGLNSPTGDGDVHVWPSVNGRGRSVVVIELSSPDGHLRARASADEVCRFLSRSLAAVPLGREARHVDLDRLLAQLLAA